MKYNFDEIINRNNTASLKWDEVNIVSNGKEVIPLWVADTDFKAPIEVIKALQKRVDHGIFGYTSISPTYNSTIREWIKKRHNWETEEEWITCTPGIVPALSFSIQTFSKEEDGILINTPIYPPFYEVPKLNNRKIIDNNLIYENNNYSIDFNDFEKKAKEAEIFLLSNPHNPTGRVFTKEELKKLGQICLENNVLIISDEIHNDIIYSGNKHICISSLSKEIEQITITCMAPSKTFSLAGLSISVIIIPNEELRNKFNHFLDMNDLYTNLLGKVALEAAYKYGEEYVKQLCEYLEGNRDYVIDFVNKNIPQIKPIKIEGTYLMWLDCKELKLEGEKLNDFFVNAGVGLNLGNKYGENGNGFMRLNIGCPKSILEDGLKKIELAVKEIY